MIAFILCALSIPPTHFASDQTQRIEEVKELREFVHRYSPGADIYLMPRGLVRLPFLFDGREIWIRRDRKIGGAA